MSKKRKEDALAKLETLRVQVKPIIRAIVRLNDISDELSWLETHSLLLDDDPKQHKRFGNLLRAVSEVREEYYKKLVNEIDSLILKAEK